MLVPICVSRCVEMCQDTVKCRTWSQPASALSQVLKACTAKIVDTCAASESSDWSQKLVSANSCRSYLAQLSQ